MSLHNDNKSCIYIFKRGKNKGLLCQKNCKNADELCAIHKPKLVVVDKCSICFENMNKKNICILDCKHKFHLKCIMTMSHSYTEFSNKCPLCRTIFTKKRVKPVSMTMEMIHEISLSLDSPKAVLIHNIIHLTNDHIDYLNDIVLSVG